jgi:amino acid transporter
MNVSDDSKIVFGYFVNLVTIFGILTWISILVTHICFVRARRAQGIADDQLAYTAPFGIWGSYGALVSCSIIAIFKNFNVFTYSKAYGAFDYKNFITGYLGIPLYLIMIFGYKFCFRNSGIPASKADLFTGKDKIDREEEEFLRRKALKGLDHGGLFYRTFIAWLF